MPSTASTPRDCLNVISNSPRDSAGSVGQACVLGPREISGIDGAQPPANWQELAPRLLDTSLVMGLEFGDGDLLALTVARCLTHELP